MTRDDVVRLAREAGVIADSPYLMPHDYQLHALERFAALVAAAEREACAKVCDRYQTFWSTSHVMPKACAEAIRARTATPC